MENKTEFRFSWTHKSADDYFKVSGDTVDDVMKGMDELEGRVSSREGIEKPLESHPESTQSASKEGVVDFDTPEDWCGVHDVKMTGKEGPYGFFYSHTRGQYPNLDYCNGKGYKSDLPK